MTTTNKQIAFLHKLIQMIEEDGGFPPIDHHEVDDLSFEEASEYIDEMKFELGME